MSGGSAVGPNLRLAAAAGLAFLAVFSLLGPLGPATVARDGATPAAAPALSHPTNAPQRPKMYTYFASVKALHPEPELLQKWKRSWAKAGWDAEILTEEDARAHPQWPKLHLALRRLPSSNPTGYDAACYFRWLAVAARGGGWLSDYDVLNYGFPAQPAYPRLTLFSRYSVPSLVSGPAEAYLDMVKTFAGYKPTEADSYEGKPHVSDMHLVQKLGNHSVVPALVEPLSADDPWERALLVHWSHEWLKNYAKLKKLEMRRLNRTKVIEDVERESLLATRGVASGP